MFDGREFYEKHEKPFYLIDYYFILVNGEKKIIKRLPRDYDNELCVQLKTLKWGKKKINWIWTETIIRESTPP